MNVILIHNLQNNILKKNTAKIAQGALGKKNFPTKDITIKKHQNTLSHSINRLGVVFLIHPQVIKFPN
jgi:hypothetical protein